MELIYDQAEERITLRRKNQVVLRASGKAAALAFVALEMGRSTNIYHKLAEGVDPGVISESLEIQANINKLEALYTRGKDA